MPSGHTRHRGRAPSSTRRRNPFHIRCTCRLFLEYDRVIVTQFVVVFRLMIFSWESRAYFLVVQLISLYVQRRLSHLCDTSKSEKTRKGTRFAGTLQLSLYHDFPRG